MVDIPPIQKTTTFGANPTIMKTKFTKRIAFFFLLMGFILTIVSSCSDLLHLHVEKRKFRDGYHIETGKNTAHSASKEKRAKVDSSEQLLQSPLFTADNSNEPSIDLGNKGDELVAQVNEKVSGTSQTNTSQTNPHNTVSKKELRKEIKKQANSSATSGNDSPCPNPRRGLMIVGIILMILGLGMLGVPSAGVMVAGVVIGLLGMILYLVGKAKGDPYVTKTEAIAIVDDNIRTALKVPQFDYKAPGSTNEKVVSLSLLTPQYAKDFKYRNESPFTEFAKSMEKDFEEILLEREYTFIGPFKDYDDMVFSDKSKTDLLLEVEIRIDWKDNLQTKPVYLTQYANEMWSCGTVRQVKTGTVTKYSFDGTAGIGAEISIKASEIMTKQKVWVKKISIDPEYITVKSEKLYNENTIPANVWTKDPGFYNPMADFLEKYYKEIMKKAWNHLDPNELKLLKPQIEKIREESGFNRK